MQCPKKPKLCFIKSEDCSTICAGSVQWGILSGLDKKRPHLCWWRRLLAHGKIYLSHTIAITCHIPLPFVTPKTSTGCEKREENMKEFTNWFLGASKECVTFQQRTLHNALVSIYHWMSCKTTSFIIQDSRIGNYWNFKNIRFSLLSLIYEVSRDPKSISLFDY